MAIREDGYDGTPIRIKRTEQRLTQLDDEELAYGEPAFLNQQQYLVIGNKTTEASRKVKDVTKVFKAINKDIVENILFKKEEFGTGIITTTNEGGSSTYYGKIKAFTQRDSEGIPVCGGQQVQVSKFGTQGAWFTIGDDGKPTITPATTVPMVQSIDIPNMKDSIIPIVSLALSNQQTKAPSTVKKIKKAFSQLTDVQSDDGKIYVFCYVKTPAENFYLDVYGG